MISSSDILVFSEFLTYLRGQEFIIGVDQHLHMHALLERVGADRPLDEMKSLLCPLFATSKRQQELFNQAFDNYFGIFKPPRVKWDEDDARHQEEDSAESQKVKAKTTTSKKVSSWLRLLRLPSSVILFLLIILMTPIEIGPEIKTESRPPVEQQNEPLKREELLPPAYPIIDNRNFVQRNSDALLIAAAVALFIILSFLIYQWLVSQQRRRMLNAQHHKKPPYQWKIPIRKPLPALFDSEQFYTAARLLRRRQVGEVYRLNVGASIAATVEAGGYPVIRYQPDTRMPEYLLLIDRASSEDHQARLFDNLAIALSHQGIFIERYFFETDPRLCISDSGARVHLTELQRKYSGHRLLIFGNGRGLLDPITGRLADWTEIFSDWQERAILTPEAVSGWGLSEFVLAKEFAILPATLDSLITLTGYFESPWTKPLTRWRNDYEHPSWSFYYAHMVEDIRAYLGKEAFQWLCACALYPTLQWPLTLYLGSVLSPENEPIKEEDVIRLVQLPWFRSGSIPDDIRWMLIKRLDPIKERAARQALINLLEDNAPGEEFKETFAADSYRLNLAAQRWLQSGDQESHHEVIKLMTTLPPSQAFQDRTLVRILESVRNSTLDVIFPPALRRVIYRYGISIFGLRTRILFTLAFILTAITSSAIIILIPPELPSAELINLPINLPTSPDINVIASITLNSNSNSDPTRQNQNRSNRNIGSIPPINVNKDISNGNIASSNSNKSEPSGSDKDRAKEYFDKGMALLDQGRNAEAEVELRQAVRFDPGIGWYHDSLGAALGAQGKIAEAEREHREAVKLDPEKDWWHANLCLNLLSQGRLDEAEAECRTALRLNGNNNYAPFRWYLGLVLERKGKYDEAEAAYREALKLDPNNAQFQNSLDRLLKTTRVTGQAEIQKTWSSPSGRYTVTLSMDGRLTISQRSGLTLMLVRTDFDRTVDVIFSPDERIFITISRESVLRLWDTSGREIGQASRALQNIASATHVVFSPDSKILVVAEGTKISLLDVKNVKPLRSLIAPGEISGINFSPDGKTFTAVTFKNENAVWDVESGRRIK